MVETVLEASPRYPGWATIPRTPTVISPFVLSWQGKGGKWVYMDTFSKSVTLAPPPPDLPLLDRDSQVALLDQRVLLPEGLDPFEEVLAYIKHLRKTVLYLEVANTHKCNMDCKFCYRHAAGVDHSATMSSETIGHLVAWLEGKLQAGEYRFLEIDILGGDPLMALDSLFELLRESKRLSRKYGVDTETTLVTNGAMLTRTLLEDLRRAGLTDLQLTFEGPPAMHNARRQVSGGMPGSYEAQVGLLRAIRGLVHTRVRVNYDRQNLRDLPQLFQQLALLRDEGCFDGRDLYESAIIKVHGGPHDHVDAYGLQELEQADVFREVLQMRLAAGFGISDADLVPEYPCRYYMTDGYAVDASGHFHSCGTGFGTCRGIGDLDSPPRSELIWDAGLLTDACLACRCLPTCLGGCPNVGNQKSAGVEHCPREFIERYLFSVADAVTARHE